jgi:hypothetical protein
MNEVNVSKIKKKKQDKISKTECLRMEAYSEEKNKMHME